MNRKRFLNLFMVMAVSTSLLAGCGSGTKTEEVVEELEIEDETEGETIPEDEVSVEEEPQAVEVQRIVVVASANEDGTFTAYDAEKGYILTLADELPEEQRKLVAADAAIIVTSMETTNESGNGTDESANDSEEAENTDETDETTDETLEEIFVTAVEAAEETAETLEVRRTVFEKVNGFSVDDSIVATMYAKQTVNVRSGPSADCEKVGSLSFAQEVEVTGQADTGWYQIQLDGATAYVSNNYLSTEKPVAQTASAGGSGSGTSSTGSSAAGNSSAAGGRDYQAEYRAAVAAGDVALAKQILAEAAGVSADSIGGGGGTGSGSGSTTTTVEKSTSLSQDFVNYLNSQRAAEGLPELSWSDSMASTALERAEEIAEVFSHDGFRNCGGEIITAANNGDVASWYNKFYNSSSHRDIMLGNWSSVSAAVCYSRGVYHVVVLFN